MNYHHLLGYGSTLALGVFILLGQLNLTGSEATAPQPKASSEVHELKQEIALIRTLLQDQKPTTMATNNILDDSGLKQTQENVLALFVELDELKKQIEHLADQPVEVSYEDSSPDPVETMSTEEMKQLNDQHRYNTGELYQATLQSEVPDTAWSQMAEEQVMSSLSEANDKLLTTDIECRESLCRLNVARANGATDDETMDAFDTHMEWAGEMSMTYDPKTGEAVVYLAREGHSLPSLEQ